jgi:uncharacterized protein involved in exopolysaccharide biosynthesis
MSAPSLPTDVVTHAIARRAPALVVLLVVAPLLANAIFGILPDRYEARARVTVQDPQTINPFLGDLAVEWDAEERVALITSVLRSPSTMQRVLEDLGEVSEHTTPEEVETAVRELGERVQVIEVGGGVVLLKIVDPDPDRAYRGATSLVDVFVAEMLRPQRENVVASAEFLQGELTQLDEELRHLERRITIYRQEHADEVPEMRLTTLAEHRQLRTALLEAEVRATTTGRQVASTAERLRDFSPRERRVEELLGAAIAGLATAQAEHEADHPSVVLARQRVERLQAELAQARRTRSRTPIEEIEAHVAEAPVTLDGDSRATGLDVLTTEVLAYRALLREQEGASAQVALLREQSDGAEATLVSSVMVEEELGRMTRELEARRAVHRELLERYEQARVIRDLALESDVQQVWVIEPPVRPTRSQKPARWMLVAGALAGALVLGLLGVAVAEAGARYARTPADAGRILGIEKSAVLPRLRGDA